MRPGQPALRAEGDEVVFLDRVPSRREIQRAYDLWSHFYDAVAAPWDFGPRMRALGTLRVRDGERVLDVGVGSGTFFDQILRKAGPNAHVYGIELSARMIRKTCVRLARALGAPPGLVQADALSLPFASESFDVVLSSYVLDLLALEDIFGALTEFRRVLKPRGRTVLVNLTKVDPDRTTWYERCYAALPSPTKAYLLGGCRPVCLENMLTAAGFACRQRIFVPQALSSEILIGQKVEDDD